jgi:hypothetical protein
MCKKKRVGRRFFFFLAQGKARAPGHGSGRQLVTGRPWLYIDVRVMRKFGDGPSILEEWVYNTPIF